MSHCRNCNANLDGQPEAVAPVQESPAVTRWWSVCLPCGVKAGGVFEGITLTMAGLADAAANLGLAARAVLDSEEPTQPPQTLHAAMASLTEAARALGYDIDSLTLTQGSARIRLSTDRIAMPDDAIADIIRRGKEARDRGEPLT